MSKTASLGRSEVQKEIAMNNGVAQSVTRTQPLWLLAEVTYRCPLHCAFCYNPTDYDKHTQNESPQNSGLMPCVKQEN